MLFITLLMKNLFRRKVRSVLTLVGVAVAVGTMVALLGIAYGFEEASVRSFAGHGTDLVVVAAGVPDQLNSNLDETIGQRIRRIPGVRDVTPGLVEVVEVQKGNTATSVVVHGWEPGSFLFNNLEIQSGRG